MILDVFNLNLEGGVSVSNSKLNPTYFSQRLSLWQNNASYFFESLRLQIAMHCAERIVACVSFVCGA